MVRVIVQCSLFLLEVGFLFFKFEMGTGFDLVVYFLFRDFSLVFDLRDKGFFSPFSFQTRLNSTSPLPTQQLAEATKTLLNSLGGLAQEVSCVFLAIVSRLAVIVFFSSGFG